MTAATHQVIRLRTGRHKSPEEGACVMELASMLAGEPFSDHPASVCPVIGAFLRRYNDAINDDRRQRLYACAAEVVGTRGSQEVQFARAQRLTAWTAELQRRRRRWYWLPERWRALAWNAIADPETVARRATREVAHHGDSIHEEVLALIDELTAVGGGPVRNSADAVGSAPRTRAQNRTAGASAPVCR